MCGFPLCGYLISNFYKEGDPYGTSGIAGWDASFYVFGLFGFIWWPIWVFRAYESPDDHPTISFEEKNIIKNKVLPKDITNSTMLESDDDSDRGGALAGFQTRAHLEGEVSSRLVRKFYLNAYA